MAKIKGTQIQSAAISATITVVSIVIMTVVAELSPEFKDWLKGLFYHHWIGKGVISAVTYVVGYGILSKMSLRVTVESSVKWLSIVSLIGTIAIYGFYLYETLAH